jgi:hypothetical protein
MATFSDINHWELTGRMATRPQLAGWPLAASWAGNLSARHPLPSRRDRRAGSTAPPLGMFCPGLAAVSVWPPHTHEARLASVDIQVTH